MEQPHLENAKESELPVEAPALADWIEEELGDEELADFLREHAEDTPFLLNGERPYPQNAYELLNDMIANNVPAVHPLVNHMFKEDFFPEVTTSTVVGDSPEYKKGHLIDKERYVATMEKLGLHDDEREKTQEDITILLKAFDSINNLRVHHGLSPIFFSPDAVHMIDRFELSDGDREGFSGEINKFEQMINMGTWKSAAMRIGTAYHELVHLGSYYALQADYDESGDIVKHGTYRMGLEAFSRMSRGKMVYLKGLNEAVTEETARQYVLGITPEDPELGYIAQARNERIEAYFRENPEYVREFGDNPEEITDIEPMEDGRLLVAKFSYRAERHDVMFPMFDKLYDKNPQRFEGKDRAVAHAELFEMLQKAMFTGNILPFGRLFNDTFGRGKFREFGHLQTTAEQNKFIEAL